MNTDEFGAVRDGGELVVHEILPRMQAFGRDSVDASEIYDGGFTGNRVAVEAARGHPECAAAFHGDPVDTDDVPGTLDQDAGIALALLAMLVDPSADVDTVRRFARGVGSMRWTERLYWYPLCRNPSESGLEALEVLLEGRMP